MSYKQQYQRSINNKEDFWLEQANKLEWFKESQQILSKDKEGIYHWFADAQLNTCYMAVDYHVNNGRANQLALIYDSPVTNTKKSYTYKQMLTEVSKCAGMIKNQQVTKGDRVIIYMPMIPQAVIAMLACARLGAIHSVVFGGFAASELANRIDDAKPKLILSASCGIEVSKIINYKPLVDEAINIANHKPNKCIIYQREQHKVKLNAMDLDWQNELSKAEHAAPVAVNGSDILYTLYTSGTTGKPKGVARENAGHAVALKYSMGAVYGTRAGETYFAASDIGWVVGHSYIVYGPLLEGCTTILYEGKPVMTPDAGSFFRVIEEYKVKTLFTAPTAYRAIRKADPKGKYVKKYNLSSLQNVFSAGERLDKSTYNWINKTLKVAVIDNWWQTETGWAIASNLIGIEDMPAKPGSVTMPAPGFEVKILDDNGEEVGAGVEGNIAIKLPLPPSCLTTIWGSKQRFIDGYLADFIGYYSSGDGGYIDKDGYLFVMGRIDDVINVAGHRLSTGQIEEVIASHENIAECAVVGINDSLKGQVPLGFIVLKTGSLIEQQQLNSELITLVRKKIGAIVCYDKSIILPRLPKTRSGKILRKVIQKIANNEDYIVPATIDEPIILDEIKKSLQDNNNATNTK